MYYMNTIKQRLRGKLASQRYHIGGGCKIGKSVRMVPKADVNLSIGVGVSIGANSLLQFRNEGVAGRLSIGDRTYLQERVSIYVAKDITIGSGCAISWDVTIIGTDFHEIIRIDGTSGPVSAPITIGNNVLIGFGAKILKGTVIGDNSIVGAGAVVSGIFPGNVVIVGCPAKVVGNISGWLR